MESSLKILIGTKDKLSLMETLMIMKSVAGSESNIVAQYIDVLFDCPSLLVVDAICVVYRPKPSMNILN